MMNNVEILTEKEAAVFLRVSVSTLKRRRSSRQVPYQKNGRLIRYSRTALLRYIEETTIANIPIEPAPTRYRRAGCRSFRNQVALFDII